MVKNGILKLSSSFVLYLKNTMMILFLDISDSLKTGHRN